MKTVMIVTKYLMVNLLVEEEAKARVNLLQQKRAAVVGGAGPHPRRKPQKVLKEKEPVGGEDLRNREGF